MVKPAVSVPVACRVTVVHLAGGGVPVEDVPGDDELPVGVPVVSCRSSTMVAAPAPAPSTASSTSASHSPVRRWRGPAGPRAGRPPGGAAAAAHGADPAPAGAEPCWRPDPPAY